MSDPHRADVTRPSPARMYDYLLGGTDNYAVDRRATEHLLAPFPGVERSAIENRRFLVRAVEHLYAAGVRQFLDLGAGLPTGENTHQVAERAGDGARVVYVDLDPAVLAHVRALLGDQARYVHADIRDHDHVLAEAARFLDLTEPVGLLAVAVLHFIPDSDDPAGLIRRYASRLTAGSYVVVTSASESGMEPGLRDQLVHASQDVRSPVYLRSHPEVETLFGGLRLVPPGLVPVTNWPAPSGVPPLVIPMLGGIAAV